MKDVIAISPDMSDLGRVLKSEGYEVVSVKDQLDRAKVVVISGMDENLMGIQDTLTSASVINATGKDVDEILSDIHRCLGITD